MSNEVLQLAKEIRVNVINNKLDETKYTDFKNKFPKFYEMLKKKNMDEEMFNKLIHLLSTKTEDNQAAASSFSQYGAEKYLYPQFGKPTDSDLKFAQNKINQLC